MGDDCYTVILAQLAHVTDDQIGVLSLRHHANPFAIYHRHISSPFLFIILKTRPKQRWVQRVRCSANRITMMNTFRDSDKFYFCSFSLTYLISFPRNISFRDCVYKSLSASVPYLFFPVSIGAAAFLKPHNNALSSSLLANYLQCPRLRWQNWWWWISYNFYWLPKIVPRLQPFVAPFCIASHRKFKYIAFHLKWNFDAIKCVVDIISFTEKYTVFSLLLNINLYLVFTNQITIHQQKMTKNSLKCHHLTSFYQESSKVTPNFSIVNNAVRKIQKELVIQMLNQ